ncbi:AAA family ATPase [Herbaspirillum frisingense]|uniref:AAA family ATPase n=1 Tax=Herbaspirillum frisingense TaxID=92645 RepID=UPI001600B03C|nr:AAA family ATPase [Herbaspirillum frisingense]QNB06823.1 AAA family ATPase [Herbaspirillum frisingense]
MKLERLHLKNFRCFDELSIEFGKRLTVIIAENGAGKTAILDAIAIGFGRYLTKLPGIAGRATKETDLRVTQGERREPFMMLAWEASTREGSPIAWAAGRKRDGAVSASAIKKLLSDEQESLLSRGLKELDDFTLGLVQADAESRAYFLPVIAYYGTNRAIREEVQRRRGFKKNFSRFDALAGSLDPDSRFRAAFEWFNAMEDAERRERETRRDFDYQHPELQAVRAAIVRLLPVGFSKPRTEIRPLRFVIDRLTPDGSTRTLRISQLSDGYRVVLGLTMDFARRMAQANSRMAADGTQIGNPLDLPAIALIDEVDLHLHPSWQQRVLTDLMQTFRNTQFIITTHSPQVLSTVKRENIRVIGPDASGRIIASPPLAMTYGEPSGDVLHSVMMVDPQPPVSEKADLQRLTEWVDQGNYQSAEAAQLMQSLIAALGEQHPQLQRLQRSIQRQEALKQ